MSLDWSLIVYYIGYAIAFFLCWGLGPIFRAPMLLNGLFNVALTLGLMRGWDIRIVIAVHGFAFFVWMLALTQTLNGSVFVFVLLLDLAVVFHGLWPDIQVAGTGPTFWNVMSTQIIEVWMTSIFALTVSVVFRSSILAKLKERRVDLLTNPRKRFLIPICAWAGMISLPPWFPNILPKPVIDNRFAIAVQLLVWGWVAFELPSYITHRRLMRQYDD
jgi:hypothetical protein